MPALQDMVLFNDTIYYNILYGRLGATPEDVFAAARQAAVHDQVIRLCANCCSDLLLTPAGMRAAVDSPA